MLAFAGVCGAFALDLADPVAWIEGLAGPLCHHLPERTLHLGSRPLPVCARCTGLWSATALGGPLGWALGGQAKHVGSALALGGLATLVGLVAALAEWGGLIATANEVRVVLGAALGVGMPLLIGLGARVLWDADGASE
jgi:uncharacterized membrane protein